MSDKAKRKPYQDGSRLFWILFIIISALMVGLGSSFLYQYEANPQLNVTSMHLYQENLTRQFQIEASGTAVVANETATAEANMTATP